MTSLSTTVSIDDQLQNHQNHHNYCHDYYQQYHHDNVHPNDLLFKVGKLKPEVDFLATDLTSVRDGVGRVMNK